MITPLLSYDIFALQRVGGISRYFLELHRQYLARGLRSTIVAPFWRARALRGVPGVIGKELPRIFDVRGGARVAQLVDRVLDPLAISCLRRNAVGLIVHRTYFSPAMPFRRVPSAITVYDMIHESHPQDFASNDLTSWRKQRWCDSADIVIAISGHTSRQLTERFEVDPDRIRVIHLGANYLPRDARILERLNCQRPFLLYVGGRSGYKNFATLLAAYARSDCFREGINLIAFGGSPVTPAERELIAKHGLHNRVTFTTGDDGVLGAHYALALALVYPSLDEGFGLPPLEAMLHGCPVAVARAGAMPEVCGEAALYFSPDSIEDTADAINAVSADEPLRRRLGILGPAHASRFSWSACADKTLDAYNIALQNFEASS